MQVDFEDGETGGRYVLRTEDGKAASTFSKAGDKVVIIDHTEVDDALRGLGGVVTLIRRVCRLACRSLINRHVPQISTPRMLRVDGSGL